MLKLVFSLCLLLSSLALGDSGYYIKNYNIDIQISDKNIYTVEEKIDVHFLEPRRGIYRVIPEKYNGREIKISDIKSNADTYAKDEGNFIYLRLGNPNKYLMGDKTYIIKYKYNIGWDQNRNYDEVYYNLIGNDWDTNIEHLNFSITLPKDFDSKKINFTMGPRNSTNTSGVTWAVNGNTISGYTTRTLYPGESVTIALPLSEGYFNLKSVIFKFYLIEILVNLLIILFPIISFVIYKKYGEKRIIVDSIEFYPPDNLTPSELGYYAKGRISPRDITSMIFYWADKGYIKIVDTKGDMEIIKIVDKIKTDKEFELYLFNTLFLYGDNGISIKISQLKNVFYKHIDKSAEILETEIVLNKKELYTYKSFKLMGLTKLFPLFIIGIIIFYFSYLGEPNILSLSKEIILGVIASVISLYFSDKIKARTEYGNYILGRILGFKKFLFTAEKPKLEMLLDENPDYFYNILPYTIVLGVSDKWAKKFSDLSVPPPEWYTGSYGTDIFTTMILINSLNRSMTNLNNSMLSAPKAPSNFGGGSSSMGGGSSGGGAGGGGGGSW
ncbi:MAG: DUF2207 domain-containing protein [Cetobacterium sp.]|uniref:DUF2207 domain-containing protein n=1 Tax=Cetobacterium sp. TaxID=2071632 RepID=UPI003F35C307